MGKDKQHPDKFKYNQEIYGIILIAGAVLLSIFVFAPGGIVGRPLAYFLKYAVGIGRYLTPLFFLIGGVFYLVPELRKNLELKIWGLLIIFITTISLVHLFALSFLDISLTSAFEQKVVIAWGGIIGASIAYALGTLVKSGAYVILFSALLIGVLLATGLSLSNVFRKFKQTLKRDRLWDKPKEIIKVSPEIPEDTPPLEEEPRVIFETQKLEKVTPALKKGEDTILKDQTVIGDYQLPPLNFLKHSSHSQDLSSKKGVRESIQILENTLRHFEVGAHVKKVTQGPTITRFEIELSPGVKVNRILNLSDDIALALASPDVRILTPVPGKSAVGIEVPNKYRQLVTLGDILTSPKNRETKDVLTFGLGKDIAGQPVLASMQEMPHLLIAGATGAGKSVCINCIITSILTRAHPQTVKMILVDPKRVEFNYYSDIPHLLAPVVTDPKKAAVVLAWAVEEMENRYKLLADHKARNIFSFNKLAEKGREHELEKLPYILIVIDELADLMMISPSEVEEAISRIAQMARAVGIHLVVATQRPSADIITGLIKSNITSRIAFAVSSQTDSRVILDTGGAEKLVGKGDMLFLNSGSLRPRRVQGSFLTEQEIVQITDFMKKQVKPEYDPQIFEQERKKFSARAHQDELVDEAMDLVVNASYASVSLLQRRLRVGYTRAARLIDILEEKGVVGGYEGSKPREVLITRDELERIKKTEDEKSLQ